MRYTVVKDAIEMKKETILQVEMYLIWSSTSKYQIPPPRKSKMCVCVCVWGGGVAGWLYAEYSPASLYTEITIM